AAPPYAQTQGSDLGVIHVDPRRTLAQGSGDAPGGKNLQQCFLNKVDQGAYPEAAAADIQQEVHHQLARPVIGHLAATVRLYNRDAVRVEDVFGFAGLTLGKHGRMFQDPELVTGISVAPLDEVAHALPGGVVILQAQAAHEDGAGGHWHRRAQSTMATRPVALRSVKSALSCSGPVAVMSSCTESQRPSELARKRMSSSRREGSWRLTTSMTSSTKPSPCSPNTLMG